MSFIQAIRHFFLKPKAAPCLEYVRETAEEPLPQTPCVHPAAGTDTKAPAAEGPVEEIAFSPHGDLESYVRGLSLPKEAIERWISAGVLLPEETRVASQMIRIICKNK